MFKFQFFISRQERRREEAPGPAPPPHQTTQEAPEAQEDPPSRDEGRGERGDLHSHPRGDHSGAAGSGHPHRLLPLEEEQETQGCQG